MVFGLLLLTTTFSEYLQIWPYHGLKRGARDVSKAAKLELRLDFSRILLTLERDGSLKKIAF